MAEQGPLYTRELLGLATSLVQWPFEPGMPQIGEARSKTCGSVIRISLRTGADGRIAEFGLAAQACAIGQASAALFAAAAAGCRLEAVQAGLQKIKAWLQDDGPLPAWPGFAAVSTARDYPSRHDAITLAWEAAVDALSSAAEPG